MHAKPGKRASWAFHGDQGWYVGPATEHYRCITTYIPKTHRERIADTATIIPSNIPIPEANLNEHLRRTADDLVHLLDKNTTPFTPSIPLSAKGALLDIAKTLHRDTLPPLHPIVEDIENKSSIATTEGGETNKIQQEIKSKVVSVPTSEGGAETTPKPTEYSRLKTTISPIDVSAIPIHPNLYHKQTQNPISHTLVPTQPTSTRRASTSRSKTSHLKRLLEKYKKIPKATSQERKTEKRNPLPPPRIPQSYVPIPKSYTPSRVPTRPDRAHPMLLRRRFTPFNSFRHRATQHLLAQNIVNNMMHVFDTSGRKESIDTLLKGAPKIWRPALSNEIGRLAQGIRDIAGNDALDFVHKSSIPRNKKVAYANMVCDHRPLKKEKYRVRLTLGGDVLEYLGDASSPAASLIESKLLFNSVISDSHRGARFMSLDIKDFFLQSILHDAEYIRIHSKYFLEDIRQKYNITSLIAPDGYVYCKIKRGMYGLKQAARLARDQLITN